MTEAEFLSEMSEMRYEGVRVFYDRDYGRLLGVGAVGLRNEKVQRCAFRCHDESDGFSALIEWFSEHRRD